MPVRTSSRRNAVLAGVLAACVLFACLVLATRLSTLIAFVLSLFGGSVVLAIVIGRRPPRQQGKPSEPVAAPMEAHTESPPVQFQTLPVTDVRLPSAKPDIAFAFAANVLWRPAKDGVTGQGEVARHEIIRRAREITKQQDPRLVSLAAADLSVALGTLLSDADNRVHVRAESVYLQLSPDDQRHLDELARLRKQAELWDFQRQEQVSKRRYLHTDVLKDSGSAVVWWLAKHEDEPDDVAGKIEVLSQLARVANNEPDPDSESPEAPPAPLPLRPAEQFESFLDSLDPRPSADARLLLTDQVAQCIDGLDHKTANEMRRRNRPADDNVPPGYWDDGSRMPPDEEPDR